MAIALTPRTGWLAWLLAGIAIACTAAVLYVPARVIALKGAPIEVGFSKGTWVDCVVTSVHPRFEIVEVKLFSVVLRDVEGTFTKDNLGSLLSPSPNRCTFTKIEVVDGEKRLYRVPYREIGGFSRQGDWVFIVPGWIIGA